MECLWSKVQHQLKNEIGDTAYKSWLSPLTVIQSDQNAVCLAAPSKMIKSWVQTHYSDRIQTLLRKAGAPQASLELVLADSPIKQSDSANNNNKKEAKGWKTAQDVIQKRISSAGTPPPVLGANKSQTSNDWGESLTASLDPRFTFENFVVGKPNELAHAAARRVSESDQVNFNPLFLYGGVGLGKTHLMHAIAWAIHKRNPERNVIYMSAEKFMYRFVRALRFKDTMAFKEQFRSVDVLMIDDVQFISGKDNTQEEFFHTFNALVDQNRQIIISADKSPSDLEGMEERLKSRLGWGLVADIHPSSYELRLGILESKLETLQARVDKNVLEFLAHRITSNIRELEGALNRVIAHSELVGRAVTMETTQDVLRDLLRANERRVTIDDIQKKVAEHFGLRMTDMASSRRARSVARPRQMAMYLCKTLTSKSLPDIGRSFGGRDHTTVMHAVKKVEELMETDTEIRDDIHLLKHALSHGA